MRYCGNRGDYIEGEFFNITTVNYFEEAPKKGYTIVNFLAMMNLSLLREVDDSYTMLWKVIVIRIFV